VEHEAETLVINRKTGKTGKEQQVWNCILDSKRITDKLLLVIIGGRWAKGVGSRKLKR